MLIAGGAAVALLWHDQRIPNDVGIVSEGMTPQLRTAIAQVAQNYGLEPGWFTTPRNLRLLLCG